MKDVKIICTLVVVIFAGCRATSTQEVNSTSASEGTPAKIVVGNELPFSSITYTWTEGAYSGDRQFQVTIQDGEATWLGLAGDEKGKSAVEQATYVELGDDRFLISWLEHEDPYTVSLVVNIKDKTITGVVSKETEHYVWTGILEKVE